MNSSNQGPTSGRSGRMLIRLLRLNLGFAGLSLLIRLIWAAFPSIYAGSNGLDGLQAQLGFWVLLIAIVVFGVWIYRLHVDLAKRFQGYPTTPRRALAQCFVPFYNLWGIPQTFRTLADRLKLEDEPLAADGKDLDNWTQWLIKAIRAGVLLALLATGTQLLVSQVVLVGTVFYLLNYAVELLQSIVWLRITLIVSRMVTGWEPAAIPVRNAAVVTPPNVTTARPIWAIALICGIVTFLAVYGIVAAMNVSGLNVNDPGSGYSYNAAYESAGCVGMLAAPVGAIVGSVLFDLINKLLSRLRGARDHRI
jgi:Domain of unknown function (DUF4328)